MFGYDINAAVTLMKIKFDNLKQGTLSDNEWAEEACAFLLEKYQNGYSLAFLAEDFNDFGFVLEINAI